PPHPPDSARIDGLLHGPGRLKSRLAPYFVGIRASASSANPAAPAEGVIHLGKSVMRSAISSTLATPTALGKYANIGWSLGESPANTNISRSRSRSMSKSSLSICLVVDSLS